MDKISLKEFISAALVDIANGIKDANEKIQDIEKNRWAPFILRKNIGGNSKISGIKFDVSVSADSTDKEKAGFFVSLVNIGGGASNEKQKEEGLTHRISFEVGVSSTVE